MTTDRVPTRSLRRFKRAALETPPAPSSVDSNIAGPTAVESPLSHTTRLENTNRLALPAPNFNEMAPPMSPGELASPGIGPSENRRLTRRQTAKLATEAGGDNSFVDPATTTKKGRGGKTVVSPRQQTSKTSQMVEQIANTDPMELDSEPPAVELKTPKPARTKRVPSKSQKNQGAVKATKDADVASSDIAQPYLPTPESLRQNRAAKRKAGSDDESLEADVIPVEPVTPTPRSKRQTKKQKQDSSAEIPPPAILTPQSQKRKHPVEKPVAKPRRSTLAKAVPSKPTVEKPPAIGKPDIWCDTRQELCEGLPSFRSYQSGCYANKGLTRGCLIDGHASERDYMDASIVISHAGGSSEDVGGERRLVKDHDWDKGIIASLRNNCNQMVPVVAIIGENCPTAPAKLDHRYSVMDWFKVTHCWPEKDSLSGKVRCKFRLEKLDSTQKGWWAAADTPGIDTTMSIEYHKCLACNKESPLIYEDEPMCLNQDCAAFWIVSQGDSGRGPERFVYRKSFLHGKTFWPVAALQPPASIAPTLPAEDAASVKNGSDIKRRFWKGVWCQKCGKLNSRELWKGWKCTNCNWACTPERSRFVPADLSDPHRPDFTGPPIPDNTVDASIKAASVVLPDGRRAITYDVYQCGQVIHILAHKNWNALPRGSDWLFDKYQDVDIPFKRHELKRHMCAGRLLTQQFSFNSGAPYKYIVEVDSLSFEDSPFVVQQALKILQKDVSDMIPDALPMNEVLNVAYFEEQKMDFHDDGEEDLGPCVSSISLGSPALMQFRIKGKYCSKVKGGGSNDEDRALLRPSNPCSTTDAGVPNHPSKRVCLELRLHHGDVVIMNGRDIQRLMEHAVSPEGFRIAATARNISPQNMKANAGKQSTSRKAKAGTGKTDVKASDEGSKKDTSQTSGGDIPPSDGINSAPKITPVLLPLGSPSPLSLGGLEIPDQAVPRDGVSSHTSDYRPSEIEPLSPPAESLPPMLIPPGYSSLDAFQRSNPDVAHAPQQAAGMTSAGPESVSQGEANFLLPSSENPDCDFPEENQSSSGNNAGNGNQNSQPGAGLPEGWNLQQLARLASLFTPQ
ncbi:hypothetical protein TWF696_001748 [Orbilia brochopaga]|uniref:Alpha-ketoglutarate-dependent dioxygenase AlkB-like domain-containing protein n=1 Tax=Orbilia brochopaga TaxID=3140254 RepID=A0AAV9U697_9PEZI